MSGGRKGHGRKKIGIKKMSNEIHLQATVLKHRSGLFKKTSKLCTLCGANVTLIVFSPGEKVFSFGHPTVNTIIDHYLSLIPPQNNSTMQFFEAQRSEVVFELNARLTMLNNTLDLEKMQRDELNHMPRKDQTQYWWACLVDEMNKDELEILKKVFEDMNIYMLLMLKCLTHNFFSPI